MAKPQAFPFVFRISSQPPRFGSRKNVPLFAGFRSILLSSKENSKMPPVLGFYMHSVFSNRSPFVEKRFFSSYVQEGDERSRSTLPWLTTSSNGERRKVGKNEINKGFKSSWEESTEKFLKGGASRMQIREGRKLENRKNELRDVIRTDKVEEEENGERRKVGKNEINKGFKSSWVESAEKFLKGGASRRQISEAQKLAYRINELRDTDHVIQEEVEKEDESGDDEVVDDPRWNGVRDRVNKFVNEKPGFERAEVRKWSNQEKWGRKTWKEAKESSVPKIVGEGIYGVGPVLAALSAARREFYAFYVQEGLDMSANNRKKKDKNGFEKVLKMANKVGLSIKDVSKHDLNMVVDNRPHQGLVLDASQLEMVGIKELDPISVEEQKGPLWLALDEVTDPQNLGAIIRSAYFFGASGVVLCAKNSAPLSGVVSKASAGALELMELRSCKNMMQFLASSAGNGWRVLGGSVSPRAIPLNAVVPGAPTILVLGSEGTGLRPLVERSCTQLIRIPGNLPLDLIMAGYETVDVIETPGQEFRSFLAVESLNVSVAAGVLLNHLIGSNYDSIGLEK